LEHDYYTADQTGSVVPWKDKDYHVEAFQQVLQLGDHLDPQADFGSKETKTVIHKQLKSIIRDKTELEPGQHKFGLGP
jgi:hypothetical protein